MVGFQWNQSHINWFSSRFQNEKKEIKSRDVQKNYRNRAGEPRLSSQDFRNLMRLVVKAGLARVTNGNVLSRKYEIKMVSEDFSYIQPLFDREFLDDLSGEKLVPSFDEFIKDYFPGLETDELCDYMDRLWCAAYFFVDLYREAFYCYNFHGNDIDRLYENKALFGKEYSAPRDYFYSIIDCFVCEYRLFKMIANEINIFFSEDRCLSQSSDSICFFIINTDAGFEAYSMLVKDVCIEDDELAANTSYIVMDNRGRVSDYNSLFFEVVKASIALDLHRSVKIHANKYKKKSDRSKRLEIEKTLEDFIFGYPSSNYLEKRHENGLLGLVFISCFWIWIPYISDEKDGSIESFEDCKKATFRKGHAFIRAFLASNTN
jgi:hypothetical protein